MRSVVVNLILIPSFFGVCMYQIKMRSEPFGLEIMEGS